MKNIKNKKISSLFLIMLMTVIFVSGCSKKEETSVSDNEGNENVEQNENITEEQNEINTSDWKIYHNEEYGFELKYPEDWECKDFSEFIPIIDDAKLTIGCSVINEKNKGALYISILNDLKEISVCDWLSEYKTSSVESWDCSESLMISAKNSCKCEGIQKINGSSFGLEHKFIRVGFNENEKFFIIDGHIGEDGSEEENIENILRTIKVLNDDENKNIAEERQKESDSLNWKIYNDEKYKYRLKYPQTWGCGVEVDQNPSFKIADRITTCHLKEKEKLGIIPTVNIGIFTMFKETSAKEWLENNYPIWLKGEIDLEYEIFDSEICKTSFIEVNPMDDSKHEMITWTFISNNKLFSIYSHVDEDGFEKENIENILRTIEVY